MKLIMTPAASHYQSPGRLEASPWLEQLRQGQGKTQGWGFFPLSVGGRGFAVALGLGFGSEWECAHPACPMPTSSATEGSGMFLLALRERQWTKAAASQELWAGASSSRGCFPAPCEAVVCQELCVATLPFCPGVLTGALCSLHPDRGLLSLHLGGERVLRFVGTEVPVRSILV